MAHRFLAAIIMGAGTQAQCRIAKVRSTGLKFRAKGKGKSKSRLRDKDILISN